jgi:hypothetical protein
MNAAEMIASAGSQRGAVHILESAPRSVLGLRGEWLARMAGG